MDEVRIREKSSSGNSRQRARLEAMGMRAGWLAHDVDLLLTEATLQTLLALVKTPHYQPAHAHLLSATHRIECAAAVTQQLLGYLGSREGEVELINLNDVVLEIEPTFMAWAGGRVALKKQLAPDLPAVYGQRFQLQQILLNLLINATEAAEAGSLQPRRVLIVTRSKMVRPGGQERFLGNTRLPGGCYACLAVHDNSIGLDAARLTLPFDLDGSSREDAHCAGFSLFVEIINRYGGGIQVQSVARKETIFRFCLPAPADREIQLGKQAAQPAPRLLVIDDDRALCQGMAEALRLGGFEVLTANSGPEGIALFQKAQGTIGAVLLDVNMPGMNGLETLQHLQQINPDVRCIICSANEQAIAVARQPYYRHLRFLPKPFDLDELLQQVAAVLAQEELTAEPVV